MNHVLYLQSSMNNFTPFETSSLELPVLPWVQDWNKKGKRDNEVFDVEFIKETDKGFLCFTSEFKFFIFQNERLVPSLVELLARAESDLSTTRRIAFQVVNKVKKGGHLGFYDGEAVKVDYDEHTWSFNPTSEISHDDVVDGELIELEKPPTPKHQRRASK